MTRASRCVVITAHEDMRRPPIAAMKAGAFDFLVKPLDPEAASIVLVGALRSASAPSTADQGDAAELATTRPPSADGARRAAGGNATPR